MADNSDMVSIEAAHNADAAASMVYVVEDDPTLLKAFLFSLEEGGREVRGFASAREALESLRDHPCAVLITDLMLPDMDGIALMKEARQFLPRLPVIIVTGFGDIPSAVNAVKSGAFDYITKPLDEEKLLQTVERAIGLSGPVAVDSLVSKAEREVIVLVAQGLSNKEIAFRLGKSVRTIENHRHRLMKKLKLTSTADLVRFAFDQGLAGPKVS